MRAFRLSLLTMTCLSLFACSGPGQVGLTSKTLPDPSPITHPEIGRGSTVMLTIIFKFKDDATGKETLQQLTTTGVIVEKNHVLTSGTLGAPHALIYEVHVGVPDYENRRHKFVTKAEIVAKSNSGLLLLKTVAELPEAAVVSPKDGPALSSTVKTIDVLNGLIPGVLHTGTVSLVLSDKKQFGFLLIDVTSSPSSPGCGVFDENGHLIALVLGPSSSGRTVNFSTVNAISVKDIRNFLDAQNVKYTSPTPAPAVK